MATEVRAFCRLFCVGSNTYFKGYAELDYIKGHFSFAERITLAAVYESSQ
jgi:hypothetical protein